MKKIIEIPVAIILFFALGASMSMATTNIDPVDHYAKVLLDGSYVDFGCAPVFTTIVGVDNLPANYTSSSSSSPTLSATTLARDVIDPTAATSSTSTNNSSTSQTTTQTSFTGPTSSQFTILSSAPVGNSTSLPSSSSVQGPTTQQCDIVVSDYMVTGSARGATSGTVTMDPIGGGVFNDAHGNLSGYAWGEVTGWINFNPIGGGVIIDANGYFHGLAWGQNMGWIDFNCDSFGTCANDPYRVRTSWRPGQSAVTPSPTPAPSSFTTSGPATSPSASTTPATPQSPSPSPSTTPSPTPSPSGPGSMNQPSTGTTPPASTPGTPTPSPTSNPSNPTTPPTPGTSTTVTPTTPGSSPTPATSTPTGSQSTTPTGPSLTDEVMGVIFRGFANLAALLKTVRGDIAFKIIALVGAAGTLLSTQTSVWRGALSILAFKKKKPWGTVYDSVTKQPLDPAYVVLKDEQGNEINTSITDLDGRYGFLTDAGRFTIVANKTNYIFPSTRLAGRTGDELYGDLYFGGPIDVAHKGDVISKNIPMDPINVDWNERAKLEQSLLKFYSKRDLAITRITGILFWFGFALSAFALIVVPSPLNVAIVALYLAVFILKETLLKHKPQGIITDKYGNPMSFSLLRIFSASLNTEIAHKATNALGQYFALVPNGSYYVKVDKKNADGTYANAYTSQPFEVKKGVIDRNFAI